MNFNRYHEGYGVGSELSLENQVSIEIVLLVGDGNSGKSTLTRTLTGKGNDSYKHPSKRNVLELAWLFNGTQTNLKTLCLGSSLNEGQRYSPDERGFRQGNTVAPNHVGALLDIYESPELGCTKAVLCISSSIKEIGWALNDYSKTYNEKGFGKHKVTHVISLNEAAVNLANFHGANQLATAGRAAANAVAAWARPRIDML